MAASYTSSMLIFYLAIVCFGTSNGFPFFNFHKDEVNNVNEAISGKTVAINAPSPAMEMSRLDVPTEPLKTSAEASLRQMIEMIKNNKQINGILKNAVKNQNSVSASAAILEMGENSKENPKVTMVKFADPVATFIGDKESIAQQQLEQQVANNQNKIKNVAIVGVAGIDDNNNINKFSTDIINNYEIPPQNVEQTTLSEIWLELNKVLSGDIPEEKTVSPISQQQQPSGLQTQDQLAQGTYNNGVNIGILTPEITNGNEQQINQAVQTVNLATDMLRDTVDSLNNMQQAQENQPQQGSANDIPVAVLSPSLSVTNLQPQQQQRNLKMPDGLVAMPLSLQEFFRKQPELAESLAQAEPVERNHYAKLKTNNDFSNIYDSDRISAPILEKPGTPWYDRYINYWAKPTEPTVQDVLNEFKISKKYELLNEKPKYLINFKQVNLGPSFDYYAQRSMEKQNEGVENPYYKVY